RLGAETEALRASVEHEGQGLEGFDRGASESDQRRITRLRDQPTGVVDDRDDTGMPVLDMLAAARQAASGGLDQELCRLHHDVSPRGFSCSSVRPTAIVTEGSPAMERSISRRPASAII